MPNSTEVDPSWIELPSQPAAASRIGFEDDLASIDSFLRYVHVRQLPPEGDQLRRAVRLTVERDADGFVVSDDFSDVYGEGVTYEEALADYRHALEALKRVLSAREGRLSDDLRERLFLLRGVLPD